MSRAVRFHSYGGPEVLQVEDVPVEDPGADHVRVTVRVAGVNPGEQPIREGSFGKQDLPSGEGTELSGVISAVGPGVTDWSVGDEVIAFSDDRNAQADEAVVGAANVVVKPPQLSWESAAVVPIAGGTAMSMIHSVGVGSGDTVVVAGGAGGVGYVVVQLALRAGATVIATAGEDDFDALRALSVTPVRYGDGVLERLREAAPDGVDAFLDTHGGGQADIAVSLGVAPERIDTIIDFDAGERIGIHTDGMYQLDDIAGAVREVAALVAAGDLEIPVKARFPLEQVQDAYDAISSAPGIGKVVLTVSTDGS